MIKYNFKKGKCILEKDGVFFSLTLDQISELIKLLQEIERTKVSENV